VPRKSSASNSASCDDHARCVRSVSLLNRCRLAHWLSRFSSDPTHGTMSLTDQLAKLKIGILIHLSIKFISSGRNSARSMGESPKAPAYTEIAKPKELQSAHRIADRATDTYPSAVVSLRGFGALTTSAYLVIMGRF